MTVPTMVNRTPFQLFVKSGIVASPEQAQGALVVNEDVNEISVVAAPYDSVTLPDAGRIGRQVIVINNGENELQIFPAAGQDLGVGVDWAHEVEPGGVMTYVSYAAKNWRAL